MKDVYSHQRIYVVFHRLWCQHSTNYVTVMHEGRGKVHLRTGHEDPEGE